MNVLSPGNAKLSFSFGPTRIRTGDYAECVYFVQGADKRPMDIKKQRMGARTLRTVKKSEKDRILDLIQEKHIETLTVYDLEDLTGLPGHTVSDLLYRLFKVYHVLTRTGKEVMLPDRPEACWLYTTILKDPLPAYEAYLAGYLSSKGSSNVVEAYSAIKDGKVLDSVNLKIDYGLGFDMHYLTSFVRAGLITCSRNKIAFFYYNPQLHSKEDIDKHMEEYAKAASDSRNERVQDGKTFEQEFYDFMNQHGNRFVFYLKGWKPQVCKKIHECRDIYDAVCYFRLGFIVDDKIVDIPYQSGEGLVMPVELKANRIDSVSKGVTGDVIDHKYAEVKVTSSHPLKWGASRER